MNDFRSELAALKAKPKEQETKESVRVISAGELLRNPAVEVPMLVDGILTKSGLSIFAGMSDLGKSAFVRQLAVYIVTGQDYFCGIKIHHEHKKVLFVSSEDDEAATSSLLHRICDGRHKPEDLEGLRFIFDIPGRLDEAIEDELNNEPADLVVIDCLMDFMGKTNINLTNEARSWLNPFKRIANEHKTQIVFLHHLSKRADEREPNKANLLGSGALEHAPRCVLELRDGREANERYLCILKANYIPKERKELALELKFEEMRFTSLGNVKPLNEIVRQRSAERSPEQREHLKTQVKELKEQGKTYREISDLTGIALGAVGTYLNGVHVQSNPR